MIRGGGWLSRIMLDWHISSGGMRHWGTINRGGPL